MSGLTSIENDRVMMLRVFSDRTGNSCNQYCLHSSKSERTSSDALAVAFSASASVWAHTLDSCHFSSANHNFQVESIVYNGGHRFPTGAPGKEELLPYKMITFNQK
jgi:hypothetical protein